MAIDVGEERARMSDQTELTALPARLDGRFVLGELIGQGAGSRVHRAHDTLLDRPAAVKVFPVADDPRTRREVRLLAALDHPGLVPVYDVDEIDGRAFVVTALYEGGSLADRLAGGPLELGDALLVAASVADALDHVHRAGVMHRAVTPSNVLFDDDGRAHLSDFGVALIADASRITDAGDVVGRPHHLAPEQVRGDAVGPAADVYALGLVLVESLTGRRAFPGEPSVAAHERVERLERGPEVPGALPAGVSALVTAMTAADPAARPRAGEVTADLRRAALAAEPLPLAAVPAPRRPLLGRSVIVAGGVAMSAVLAGTVVFASTRPVQEISATLPPAAVTAAPAPAAPRLPITDGSSSGSSDSDSSGSGASDSDSVSSGTAMVAEAPSATSGLAGRRGVTSPATDSSQAPSPPSSTPATPPSAPPSSSSPSAPSTPSAPQSDADDQDTAGDDSDSSAETDDSDHGLVGDLLGKGADHRAKHGGDRTSGSEHRKPRDGDQERGDGRGGSDQGLLSGLL